MNPGGATPDDLAELANLQHWAPGYVIGCDGRNWAATNGDVLLVAGAAETLAALIESHREDTLGAPLTAGLAGDRQAAAP